jgi:hypothetical protein
VIEVTPRFGQMIGCDFDGRSRAAVLLRSSNGELVASIDGELRPVPEAWTNHACMIRWADDSRVFVWPIALHAEPHVGVIGSGGVSTMNVGLPLDMFGGKGLLVCTYAEDQITGPVEEADLIATFEIPSFRKNFAFCRAALGQLPWRVLRGGRARGTGSRIGRLLVCCVRDALPLAVFTLKPADSCS